MAKEKRETLWYDDLCKLYQKTRIPELRNILWEQVKLLLYSRIRKFVTEKKSSILKRDPDLVMQLYQDAFFIFQKACDVWDPTRNTRFLTFLSDIIDQEVLNIIRLDIYHKVRDSKIKKRIEDEMECFNWPGQIGRATERKKIFVEPSTCTEDFEKEKFFEEVRHMFENYCFENQLERDIVYTTVYGKPGEWVRLQKKSRMSIENFYKLRDATMTKLKHFILENCTKHMKDVLCEVLNIDSVEEKKDEKGT
ncbi:hypothetical protein A2Z67_00905 [Candidatus Woesebacteria bacterium RBG_13_36_22]|uniref:RNA polymerase sigma-70 region 2 domain-containing protein n=1 Tax=Candidatus Woesebacteria bacterium RBG_13_36_22 TaxID=1802478 RepID=A0A1F7WZH2_9BACT|nr:MAG: hypothetical protein A2Z67_00905 [Candidatus Woesebacteria bacterium RBG_13_36_22]